jgi:hypothetical protein
MILLEQMETDMTKATDFKISVLCNKIQINVVKIYTKECLDNGKAVIHCSAYSYVIIIIIIIIIISIVII